MKINTSYDWSFKIKDEASTRSKHAATIRRMKEAGVKYSDIIDYYFDQELLTQVMFPSGQRGNMWFTYYFQPKVKEAGTLTKTMLRELKSTINGTTRMMIQRSLEYNGYPKSWDTAFYMAYKPKIDSMMTRTAKEIVRNYL